MITNYITDGRSGSQVLSEILKTPVRPLPGYDSIMIPNVIAVAAWYIWWIRRKLSHGEEVPLISQCINSIKGITANSAKVKSCSLDTKEAWQRPRSSIVKLNVDAAYSLETGTGASGAVLRNCRGDFITAASTFIPHVASSNMAEATAMLHGLSLANRLGYTHIEAESDSLEVINLCSGTDQIWSDAVAIYADILVQARGIGKVEFMHCRRDANKVAHEIAKNCLSSSTSCSWVTEPPSFILQTLLNDVMII
jgi:ribonuclease HI